MELLPEYVIDIVAFIMRYERPLGRSSAVQVVVNVVCIVTL